MSIYHPPAEREAFGFSWWVYCLRISEAEQRFGVQEEYLEPVPVILLLAELS